MTFSEIATLIKTIDLLLEENPMVRHGSPQVVRPGSPQASSSLPLAWPQWVLQTTPTLKQIRAELLGLLQIDGPAAGPAADT